MQQYGAAHAIFAEYVQETDHICIQSFGPHTTNAANDEN
jgi:hypothetical protein